MKVTAYVERVTQQFADQVDYWDRTYHCSDVRSLIYQDRQDTTLRWVDALNFQFQPGARALDVGTGAGHAAVALAQRGFNVEAIDATEAMLSVVRNNAQAAGVGEKVATHVAQAHALSYRDGEFDPVIALGVLPWLEYPDAALAEMRRVLRSGGYAIVSTANRWKLTYRLDPLYSHDLLPLKRPIRALMERAGRWPTGGPPSFLLSIEDANRLVDRAGLRRTASKTLGFGPFTFVGRQLLPARLATSLHMRLQGMADRGVPVLQNAGAEYLILAQRL